MRSTTIVTFHTEKFLSFPKRKIMQKVLNARVVASAGSIFLLPKWSQFCDSATEDKRHNKTTGYKLYSCMPIRDLFVNSQHRNIATRLLRKKTHKSTRSATRAQKAISTWRLSGASLQTIVPMQSVPCCNIIKLERAGNARKTIARRHRSGQPLMKYR